MLNVYRLTLLCLITLASQAQVSFTAAIVPVNQNLCTDKAITFSVSTDGDPSSYNWSIYTTSGVQNLSDLNGSTFSVLISKDLTYTISLSMTTSQGNLLTKKAFKISRTAIASFNASFLEVGHPTELELTNYSSYAIKNYWYFQPENSVDSSVNLVKPYLIPGNYSVSLVAVGSKGCNDTLNYSFDVVGSSTVTLPNVFTPNGDDINDKFKPITEGIQFLNCWIFDRQSNLIYKFTTVEGFWDGRSSAGEPCSDGVYTVVFEAWGFDGKEYKLNGNLTLLR